MMLMLLFLAAVLCMVAGHICKVKRWALLIAVYEKPSERDLLNALVFGHTLNAVLPFRVGDIMRVLWAGRKMENGASFSLATVLVDIYIDALTVGAMFSGLSMIGKGGERLLRIAYLYMCIFLIIIPLTVMAVLLRRLLKRLIRGIAGIFNEKIEFRLLYVSYLCIASLKDIVKNINKRKFAVYSVGIWVGYVASYVVFAEAVQRYGYYYSTSDVFTELFSGASLYNIAPGLVPFWGAYLLLPLAACWALPVIRSGKDSVEGNYKHTLPQLNRADRLTFLKIYYEDENREHIQAYLGINQDVTVVEDNSAGSNASTVLVMKPGGDLFYRKYAFDADGVKLWEQINWIEKHQMDIPLPIIVEKRNEHNYVSYDMHSYANAAGLFRYIHTMPLEAGWNVLRGVLDEIRSGLHTRNRRQTDVDTISRYIEQKVEKNLKIIRDMDKYIKALEQYDRIIVNGIELYTLGHYQDMLCKEHLKYIFSEDEYADIHGDLTIENIICLSDTSEIDEGEYRGKVMPHAYYFIDPNVGNIHESPFLDYGKLLQSLHGNYEFLMMVTSVGIEKNKVNFLMTKSEAYGKIYRKYKGYLQSMFSREQCLSIYYHEVIHWLRLLPYKIQKDEKNAVVFYAGLLTVLNDVRRLEYGDEDKIGHF